MSKIGFIYIMTNSNHTALYIGVTNDLCRRIYEHKKHLMKNSFTDKYNLEYCIYYEEFPYFDLDLSEFLGGSFHFLGFTINPVRGKLIVENRKAPQFIGLRRSLL